MRGRRPHALRARDRLAKPAGLIAAIAIAAGTLAACGPDDSENAQHGDRPVGENATRTDPPPAKESLEHAQERVLKAVASESCDRLNELVPLSRPAGASEERCESIRRLDGLKVLGAEEYGDQAAVIDFQYGSGVASAVLLRDADGKYRLPFVDFGQRSQTVGTETPQEYSDSVRAALTAIRDRSCDAYLAVVFRRFGPGGGDLNEACSRLEHEDNEFANVLEVDPFAEPKELGGNRNFAFFSLPTAFGHYTVVMMSQEPAADAPDAAEYAYFDSFLTNGGDVS